MPHRIIDISVPIENDVPADPPQMAPAIRYLKHKETLPQLLPFFPGLQAVDLPDGEAWAIEQVSLTTHNGTHVDAPWHFHSTMNNGERAWTIDEVPLESCTTWSSCRPPDSW
jgi:kynurenine formamidase